MQPPNRSRQTVPAARVSPQLGEKPRGEKPGGALSGSDPDAARRRSTVPAFDPKQWAAKKKKAMEKAEQLRCENRARLRANGQLVDASDESTTASTTDDHEPRPRSASEVRDETFVSKIPPPRALGRPKSSDRARDASHVSSVAQAAPRSQGKSQTPWANDGDAMPQSRPPARPSLSTPWAQHGGDNGDPAPARRKSDSGLALSPPWQRDHGDSNSAAPRAQGRPSVSAAPPWALHNDPVSEETLLQPAMITKDSPRFGEESPQDLDETRWPAKAVAAEGRESLPMHEKTYDIAHELAGEPEPVTAHPNDLGIVDPVVAQVQAHVSPVAHASPPFTRPPRPPLMPSQQSAERHSYEAKQSPAAAAVLGATEGANLAALLEQALSNGAGGQDLNLCSDLAHELGSPDICTLGSPVLGCHSSVSRSEQPTGTELTAMFDHAYQNHAGDTGSHISASNLDDRSPVPSQYQPVETMDPRQQPEVNAVAATSPSQIGAVGGTPVDPVRGSLRDHASPLHLNRDGQDLRACTPLGAAALSPGMSPIPIIHGSPSLIGAPENEPDSLGNSPRCDEQFRVEEEGDFRVELGPGWNAPDESGYFQKLLAGPPPELAPTVELPPPGSEETLMRTPQAGDFTSTVVADHPLATDGSETRNGMPRAKSAASCSVHDANPEDNLFQTCREQPDDGEEWMNQLRGDQPPSFSSSDPTVFGNPKAAPRHRRSSSRSDRSDEGSRGGACERRQHSVATPELDLAANEPVHDEETANWLSGLRGSDDGPQEDPDVFGSGYKPKKQAAKPKPPRQRAAPKPPRPETPPTDHRPSSGGSRPSSGVMNNRGPAVGSLPEGMRKRMEAREREKEWREQERAQQRRGSRQGTEAPSAEHYTPRSAEASPRHRAQNGSPRGDVPKWGAVAAACEEDEDQPSIRLPPLDRGGRARRCSSQPPAESDDGVPQRQRPKKQERPRSMDTREKKDEEEKCGRQMFDKNFLRLRERDLFSNVINTYRHQKFKPMSDRKFENDLESHDKAIRVCVRKRPIFDKEMRQDYDVVSVVPGETQIMVHNCRFEADLKTPFLQHHIFEFDRVFAEDSVNEDVYAFMAAPLVQRALDGGISTMFMFGQTGSGKTHTMTAVYEAAAHELFAESDGEEPWLSLQFIELRGNRCHDLLAQKSAKQDFPELKLQDNGDGTFVTKDATDLFPRSPEELCAMLRMAQERRATCATEANSVSSRSHAVCTLRMMQSEGQLMLIDCAGTERRKDSMWHSKERQVEGAEINASLHALKECIRSFTDKRHVPPHMYRASSLTKVLAEAFTRVQEAQLGVICTVAPCATDTDHTITTLRTGSSLLGHGNEKEVKELLTEYLQANKKQRVAHPKTWKPDDVIAWLEQVKGGAFQDVLERIPSNFTGQMLVRLTEARCMQLCGGSERRGRQLFDLLHQEMQRSKE